ncbi:MAG: hypothetical protein EXR72_04685 [Myxococcales bacterium]|nr:hypothetical protein [Myxococcales bacterium]
MAGEPSNEALQRTLDAPALLADVIGALLSGEELYARLAAGSKERERVWWRLNELWARTEPLALLTRLDEQEVPAEREALADRLRAEALLELGRSDEAGAILERSQARVGPAWDLLRARLAFARRRPSEALAALDALLAEKPEPELQATALSFRMRYRALAGNPPGVAEDRRALSLLLGAHGANLSEFVIDVYGSYAQLPERSQVVRHKIALVVAETKGQLTDGINEEQAALGPLPLHVHALFVKLRADPQRLADLATRLAGAEYLAGDRAGAFATLYYADQIAARLLGAGAVPVREAFDELCRILGAERAAIEADLRERGDQFLRARPKA